MSKRSAAAAFIIVALLHLVPVWSVTHVPTTDGPSHTYNSWILHQLVTGRSPFLARYFAIDWRPYPNWLGHAFMAAAMTVVPPEVAEKLLFSAILLVFFTGAWMLGGPTFSFLAFPLAFHLLLQSGFYNYSLGVGLYAIVVAAWWKHRERVALNAALLLLCYFAHVVPAAMAVVSIALLWLLADRKPRQLLAFVPVGLLFGWFALHPILRVERWSWKGALLWWPLWRLPLLLTFDARQLWLGTGLAILYAILIAVTLVWRRRSRRRPPAGSPEPHGEADPFLFLTILCVIIYLGMPIGAGEGLVMKARFLIFPYLVALRFFRVPEKIGMAIVVMLMIVSLPNVVFIRRAWRRADREITRFVRPLQQVPPRHTLLPLLFDRRLPLSHAVDYAAIDRELVDFDNYEAALGDFPVKFRPEVRRPAIFAIETSPATVLADADFIYTWKEPPGWHAPARYRLVAQDGDARLYGSEPSPPGRRWP
ncbi:MAG TPA: hypothetical protein VGS96_13390 [Thermoanaerobaculia bacterium]|nr:hypothetical protein [Thermoanaerobaculia bacterium]